MHLIRRDHALAPVSPGWDVPADDVETAATTLIEVTPRRLAELSVP